ncbi:DUF2333 family protein [Temperatibacter marinus]|uniref:DUF2333 family protein n=1 Tax=Temperatibacter marinus TaxID=1456591 RepID=A0AA52EIB5_9PROT|nr:DUF2333 family protein [Temperatibacter marinus]WND03693.1 DUF2333 family protein [Temperatibacter marinus]
MAGEIWLFIKEKLRAMMRWIGSLFVKLWLYIKGLVSSTTGDTWRKILVGLPLVFVVYILLGMPIANRIDDDLSPVIEKTAGGSFAVDTIIHLVDREVEKNNWTANDPFFFPAFYLDNTPNYQRGMIAAISRFSFELRDQIGRVRSSSAADKDLDLAAGNLSKDPNEWVLGGGKFLPRTASDSFYKEGLRQLQSYNARVANGDAVFERRSDNLLATLERIASDLGASSAAQDQYIEENAGGFLPDFGVDNEFYQIKGQVYAYAMILTALQDDFSKVLKDRELESLYRQLLISMRNAANLDPLVVTNGSPSGIVQNHLSIQGFYLLRARTQLKEITNVLLK